MKYKFVSFLIIIVSFLTISTTALASTTNGTVTGYGWGENVGWVDFGSTAGDVHITDTAVTGYAYGENIGWIDLSTVTNNGNGNLTGYAWGENIGWVDFSKVTIGTDGVFAGAAYGENIGWITFGTENNKVMTDWRPLSARTTTTTSSVSSGGGMVYGCKDPTAINYNAFSASQPSLCQYTTATVPTTTPTVTSPTTSPTSQILNSGKCSPELTLTDNLRQGDQNGKYSVYNKGIVKQVAILQTHINRILAVSYKQAAGPVDGIYGPLTKQGVKRLQIALNSILKPNPLLVIDGIVGPFTRGVINNSCGL